MQQSVSSAFLASLFSDYMLTSRIHKISCDGKIFKATELRDFAKSQVTTTTTHENLYINKIKQVKEEDSIEFISAG